MIRELWEKTRGLYLAGNLTESERACRQLLDKAPNHAQAWFHLGLVAYRTGRHEDVVAALRRAIRIQPGFAEAHNNLGSALARLGKPSEAAASFQEALRLVPGYPEALNNLANVHRDQGRLDEAIAGYEKAIGLKPEYTEAHNNLGIACSRKGDIEKAVACYQRALELCPQYAEAANNLGIALARQKRLDEAVAQFERALTIKPDYADAYSNLGTALAEQGNHPEAEAAYRQALELQPKLYRVHNSLGSLFAGQGRLEEAIGCFRRAVRGAPDYAEAHANLGKAFLDRGETAVAAAALREALRLRPNDAEAHTSLATALVRQRQFGEAFQHYSHALRLRPDLAEAHYGRATAALLLGDFERGWPEYEWRSKRRGETSHEFSKPLWQGEPLKGRSILLSVGRSPRDAFQFIRYARLVQERGGRVIVRCPRPLIPILETCCAAEEFCGEDGPLPDFDVQISLASLPRAFGTILATIPVRVPYLEAEPALVDSWKSQLAGIGGFKVGIGWQDNAHVPGASHGSIPLDHFAPLAAIPGVQLVSLQKGSGQEQVAEARFSIVDLGTKLDEIRGQFMDTAAVLKNLDLVITADTALAHLAGALGVAVWALLPYVPDWRWLLDREDCPWYPTMRLFRQARPDDWHEVFASVAENLMATAVAGQAGQQLAAEPPTAERLNSQGVEFVARRRMEEAIGCFRQAISLNPQYAEAHSNLGNALRTQRRTKEAIAALEKAITVKPDYAESHYNLGLTLLQAGKLDEAIVQLQRAVDLKPALAEAHSSLGVALLSKQRPEKAITVLRRAIQLQPAMASAHNHLGNALVALSKSEEAIASYREAIRIEPVHAEAYNNLGNALRESGQLDEAAKCFEEALAQRPDFAEAHNNLGITCARQGKLDLAVKHCEQALRLKPNYAAAHSNLGIAYAHQNEFDKAVSCYHRALEIKPDYAEAYSNMGIVLTQQGLYRDAIASFQRAIELKDPYPEAQSNLGIALTKAGKTEDAIGHYQEAIRIKPDYADAHMNQALTYLAIGDFGHGWTEYEWRWKCNDFNPRRFPQPRWQGEPLQGRRILLCSEQGFGDSFQFIRYAQAIKERGGEVLVRCPKPLMPILRRCAGIDGVCAEGEPLPAFDTYIELLSLPLIFGTTVETIPCATPYIFPDPELVDYWGRDLACIRALKVGIHWQGSTKYRGDRLRSMPLAHFAPLAGIPGVRLISLQKGYGTEQIQHIRFPLTVLGGQVDEARGAFMDTAAVLKNLDLVVTCDTALAHLAGGLGVRVWLPLPDASDWRWMFDREDCPWYPTMRLFRQTEFANWEEVFGRMAAALSSVASEHQGHGAKSILVETSPGDLIDKITILRTKAQRITDAEKLQNVSTELAVLSESQYACLPESARLAELTAELQKTNEAIWDIEDQIRRCEARQDFGDRFVELARSVYRTNDRRAAAKRAINDLLGSRLVEEKEYVAYEMPSTSDSQDVV